MLCDLRVSDEDASEMFTMLDHVYNDHKRQEDGDQEPQRYLFLADADVILLDTYRDDLIEAMGQADEAEVDDHVHQ